MRPIGRESDGSLSGQIGNFCKIPQTAGCDGGAYRIRTDDILLAKQALYQLS